MTVALVFALPGNEAFADRLAVAVNGERGHLPTKRAGSGWKESPPPRARRTSCRRKRGSATPR
jgi:hypothetical protein